MSLRDIIINALRNRILPIVTRIQLMMNPSYLRGRASEFIRTFLQRLLNVRPKDKDDYYPIARWLVSKRLAYAIVIFLGIGCLLYIYMAKDSLVPGHKDNNIKTYDYNSILLKFAKGRVRIRAKSGYVAFEGEVEKAACNGEGTLKNPAGVVVYEGNFASSMYDGLGKKYYADGTMQYDGNFKQNEYSGEGKLYRSSGSLEYAGEFAQDMKEGSGTLYSPSGQQIYVGDFSKDEIVYSSLLGKSSSDMAETYSGDRKLYVDDVERVRVCEDIGVVTEEILDEQSIDSEATVEAVYVMSDKMQIGGKSYQSFEDLDEAFGEPTYTGESYATLAELLVINRLNDASDIDVIAGPAEITETDVFTEYTEVEGYPDNYAVWLHSYEKDGLVYNFVSNREDAEFSFFYILNSDLSDER